MGDISQKNLILFFLAVQNVCLFDEPALSAAFDHDFRQTADIMITAAENKATLSFGYALLGDH